MAEVLFTGGRSISGSLMWPQEAIWGSIKRDRPYDGHMNSRFRIPVASSMRIEDIGSAVRAVVLVHESLRTTFPTAGDGQSCHQRVHPSGRLEVLVTEMDQLAIESFQETWGQRSFDTARGWPVRFAVVTARGRAIALVGAASHLVLDKFGERALIRDIRSVLAGSAMRSGERRITAVDRARDESGSRLTAISDRAVVRWRELLGPNESRMFPTPLTGRGVLRSSSLVSPQATVDAKEIATRLRVSSASVFMAATAVLVSSLSNRAAVVLQSMLSNRFSPAEASFVGNLAQAWGVRLNVGARAFVEIASDAYTESLRSYTMSRYDPKSLLALRRELRDCKGLDAPQWFDSFHNDTRSPELRTAPRRAAAERTLTDERTLSRHGSRLYVEIREVRDCVEIFVIVNSQFVSPNDPQALAIAIETLLGRVAGGHAGSAVAAMVSALDGGGTSR